MPEQMVLDTAATAVIDEHADAAAPAGESEERPRDELVLEELLVEEVSIDGMCGVY